MKFGLTGFVDGKFTNHGINRTSETTAISFSNDNGNRIISLPIDGKEVTFSLVQKVQVTAGEK